MKPIISISIICGALSLWLILMIILIWFIDHFKCDRCGKWHKVIDVYKGRNCCKESEEEEKK